MMKNLFVSDVNFSHENIIMSPDAIHNWNVFLIDIEYGKRYKRQKLRVN